MQTRRRGGREVCFRERALLCRLRRFPSNNCHAEKWVVRRREKSHNVLFVGPVQRLRAEAFACPSVRQTGSLAIVRYYLSRSLIRALLAKRRFSPTDPLLPFIESRSINSRRRCPPFIFTDFSSGLVPCFSLDSDSGEPCLWIFLFIVM